MQRIYDPPEEIEKREGIRLPDEKARYLLTVLRCRKGDRLVIIDGRGRAYETEITATAKREVEVSLLNELAMDTESPFPLILCQGVLKGEKMDLVIQKATELGVAEIIPLVTERAVVKETRKTARWQRIAEEAAEQCGRAVIPRVHEPAGLRALFEGRFGQGARGLVFWEKGGSPLKEAVQGIVPSGCHPGAPILLLVGPEGGLTEEEVREAEGHGLVRTTLGKRILRAETAAIVSVALAQFLLEG